MKSKPGSSWTKNSIPDLVGEKEEKDKHIKNTDTMNNERQTVDLLIEMGKRISHLEDQLEVVNEQLKLASDVITRKDSEIELLKSQLAHVDVNNWPSDPDLIIPGTEENTEKEYRKGTGKTSSIKKNVRPVIKVPKYVPKNPLETNDIQTFKSLKRPFIDESDIDNLIPINKRRKYVREVEETGKPPSIGSCESITDILEEESKKQIHSRKNNSLPTNSVPLNNEKNKISENHSHRKQNTSTDCNTNLREVQHIETDQGHLHKKDKEVKHKIQSNQIVSETTMGRYLPGKNKIKNKKRSMESDGNGLENLCEKRSELIGKTTSEFNEYLMQRKQAELGSTSSVDETFDDIYDELNERCQRFVNKFALLKEKMEASSLYGNGSISTEDDSISQVNDSENSINVGKLIVVITELNDRATSGSNETKKKKEQNEKDVVSLSLYSDGMQVQDRPFRKYATPSVEHFFKTLEVGYYPTEKKGMKRTVYKILDFRAQNYSESLNYQRRSIGDKKKTY